MGIIPRPSESQVSGPAGRVMGAGGAGPSPVQCVWSPTWESGPNPELHPWDHTLPHILPAEACSRALPRMLAGRPTHARPGTEGASQPSGSFADAREASPSYPLVTCLWTSHSASLRVGFFIYKVGLKMPVSQACSESWLSFGLLRRNLKCWSGSAPPTLSQSLSPWPLGEAPGSPPAWEINHYPLREFGTPLLGLSHQL